MQGVRHEPRADAHRSGGGEGVGEMENGSPRDASIHASHMPHARNGPASLPTLAPLDLTAFGHSLYHAYLDYCKLPPKGRSGSPVVVHQSSSTKMSVQQLTRLVGDLGLLSPHGPVSHHIIGVIHASYRPLGATSLTFGTFLQAMAAICAEARQPPDTIFAAIAALAIQRPWSGPLGDLGNAPMVIHVPAPREHQARRTQDEIEEVEEGMDGEDETGEMAAGSRSSPSTLRPTATGPVRPGTAPVSNGGRGPAAGSTGTDDNHGSASPSGRLRFSNPALSRSTTAWSASAAGSGRLSARSPYEPQPQPSSSRLKGQSGPVAHEDCMADVDSTFEGEVGEEAPRWAQVMAARLAALEGYVGASGGGGPIPGGPSGGGAGAQLAPAAGVGSKSSRSLGKARGASEAGSSARALSRSTSRPSLEDRVGGLESRVKKAEVVLGDFRDRVDGQMAQYERWLKERPPSSGASTPVTSTTTGLDAYVLNRLQALELKVSEDAATAAAHANTAEEEIKRLQQQLGAVLNALEAAAAKTITAEMGVIALEERAAALELAQAQAKAVASVAPPDVGKQQAAALSALASRVAALEQAAADTPPRRPASAAVPAMPPAVADMEVTVASHHTRLEQLTEAINSVQAAVSSAEAAVADAMQASHSGDTSLGLMSLKIAQMEGSMDHVHSKLGALDTETKNLAHQLVTMQAKFIQQTVSGGGARSSTGPGDGGAAAVSAIASSLAAETALQLGKVQSKMAELEQSLEEVSSKVRASSNASKGEVRTGGAPLTPAPDLGPVMTLVAQLERRVADAESTAASASSAVASFDASGRSPLKRESSSGTSVQLPATVTAIQQRLLDIEQKVSRMAMPPSSSSAASLLTHSPSLQRNTSMADATTRAIKLEHQVALLNQQLSELDTLKLKVGSTSHSLEEISSRLGSAEEVSRKVAEVAAAAQRTAEAAALAAASAAETNAGRAAGEQAAALNVAEAAQAATSALREDVARMRQDLEELASKVEAGTGVGGGQASAARAVVADDAVAAGAAAQTPAVAAVSPKQHKASLAALDKRLQEGLAAAQAAAAAATKQGAEAAAKADEAAAAAKDVETRATHAITQANEAAERASAAAAAAEHAAATVSQGGAAATAAAAAVASPSPVWEAQLLELGGKVEALQHELEHVHKAASEVKAQRDQIVAWQAEAEARNGAEETDEVKRMVAEAAIEARQAVEGLRGEIQEFKQSFHRRAFSQQNSLASDGRGLGSIAEEGSLAPTLADGMESSRHHSTRSSPIGSPRVMSAGPPGLDRGEVLAIAQQAGEDASAELKQVLELTAKTLSARVDDVDARLSDTISYLQSQVAQLQQQVQAGGGSGQADAATQQRVGTLQAKVDEMGSALVLVTQKLSERMNTMEVSISRAGSVMPSPAITPPSSNPGNVHFDLTPRTAPPLPATRTIASVSEGGAIGGARPMSAASPASRVGSARPKSARERITELQLAEKAAVTKLENQLKSDEERIKAQREAALAKRKDDDNINSARNSPQRPMSAVAGNSMFDGGGDWGTEPAVRPQSAYGVNRSSHTQGTMDFDDGGPLMGRPVIQPGAGGGTRRVRYEDEVQEPAPASQEMRSLLGAHGGNTIEMADESYGPIELNPLAQQHHTTASGSGAGGSIQLPDAPSLRMDIPPLSEPEGGFSVLAPEVPNISPRNSATQLSLAPTTMSPRPSTAGRQPNLSLGGGPASANDPARSMMRMGALSLESNNGRGGWTSPGGPMGRVSMSGMQGMQAGMQAGFMNPMIMGNPQMLARMQSMQKAQMLQGRGGPNSDGSLPAHLRKL